MTLEELTALGAHCSMGQIDLNGTRIGYVDRTGAVELVPEAAEVLAALAPVEPTAEPARPAVKRAKKAATPEPPVTPPAEDEDGLGALAGD